MSNSTPGWFAIAMVLFFVIDVVVIALVLVVVRKRKTQRGFEVITKPVSGKGQEARKD